MPNFIATMPKAELHMHIEGSIDPASLLELARRNGVELPFRTVEEISATYEFENLQGFLDMYYRGLTVMRSRADFEAVTLAYLRQAAAESIRHTEMFISPQAHLKRGISMDDTLGGIEAAIRQGATDFGISASIIIVIQRQFSDDDALAMMDAAAPFASSIVGIGLGGPEVGNPPSKFKRAFARARDMGWRTVAHAGEEGGPDYIWEALDDLGVDRIDHGVRAIEDAKLVRTLAERGTPLTVCPLSNVCLKVFPDLASHSLKRLYDAGVKVTINTDDPPYFGGYLVANFEQTQAALGLSDADVYTIAANAFEGSFVPDATKAQWLDELAAHRAAHAPA